MTRDDLKEGMIIEERSGEIYRVGANEDVLFLTNNNIWCEIKDYKYDLTDNSDMEYDIIKVYDGNMNLLWDREQGNIDIDIKMFENTIKKYRVNPVQFIKDYLGIKLTSYQEMMLKKILNEREE